MARYIRIISALAQDATYKPGMVGVSSQSGHIAITEYLADRYLTDNIVDIGLKCDRIDLAHLLTLRINRAGLPAHISSAVYPFVPT